MHYVDVLYSNVSQPRNHQYFSSKSGNVELGLHSIASHGQAQDF